MKETLIRKVSDTCVTKAKNPSEFVDIVITEVDTESEEPCYKFKIKHTGIHKEHNILEFDLENKDKLIDLKNKIVELVNQFE